MSSEIETKLDTLKQIRSLSENMSTSLDQISCSCAELKAGVNTSTLNQLEKMGITKVINTIYNSCGSIRSTKQIIYDLANSNMKK